MSNKLAATGLPEYLAELKAENARLKAIIAKVQAALDEQPYEEPTE